MVSTSYTEARGKLDLVFDRVCHDHEPLLITRESGRNVVVLSEEDFSSLEETAYLLHSPANAKRLLEAVARDREGKPGRSLESVLSALNLDGELPDAD